jgi:hypothetical protein
MWWQTALVALGGALVGGGLGLVGALRVARSTFNSALLGQRAVVVAARRERLIGLYAKTGTFARTLAVVVSGKVIDPTTETAAAKAQRQSTLLKTYSAEWPLVVTSMLLEPAAAGFQETLKELQTEFVIYMAIFNNEISTSDGGRESQEKIEGLVTKLIADLQGSIADLDKHLDALVGQREIASRRWAFWRRIHS